MESRLRTWEDDVLYERTRLTLDPNHLLNGFVLENVNRYVIEWILYRLSFYDMMCSIVE